MLATDTNCNLENKENLENLTFESNFIIYSKTRQSADFGTEQNCTADCEIRRLRVLLYVVNGTEWCITQC